MEIDLKEETDDEETDEEILLTFSGPKLIYYEHSYVKNYVALCEVYDDCVLDSGNVCVSPEPEENQVPVRRSQRQINKLEKDVSTSVPDTPDTVQVPTKLEVLAETKSKEQNEVNAESSPKQIKKSEQDAAVTVLNNADVLQSPIKSEMCLEVKCKANMEQNILPIRRSQRQINKSEQVVPASVLNEQDVKELPLKSEMRDELKSKENIELNEVPVRRSQRQINKSEQDVPASVLDKTDVIQSPVKNEIHVVEKSKVNVEQNESNVSASNLVAASPLKNKLSKNVKKLVDVAVCLEKLHSDQLSPSKIPKKVKISDPPSSIEKKVETSLKRKLSEKGDLVAIGKGFKEKCVTDSSPVKTRRKRAHSEPSKNNLNLPNVCAIDKEIIKIKKARRSPKQISCLGKTKLSDKLNINLSSVQKKKRRMSAPSGKIDIIKTLKKPSDTANNGKQKVPSVLDHAATAQPAKIKNLTGENKGPVAKGVSNTSSNAVAKPKFKKAFRRESLRLVINEDEPALFSQPDVMVKIKSEDTLKKEEANESEVKDPSPNYECSESLSKLTPLIQTPEKVEAVKPVVEPELIERKIPEIPDEPNCSAENLESDVKELAKDSSACEQDDMKDLDSENSLHIDESVDKNLEGENQEISMKEKKENMNDSVAGSFEIENAVIKDSVEEKTSDESLNLIPIKPVDDSKQDHDSDKPIAERRPRRNVKKKEFFEDVAMRSSAQPKKSVDKLKGSNKIPSEDDSKDGRRKSATKTEAESEESSEEEEDDPTKLWCICRQPHNNRFMIQCDLCEDWFHGSCVGITRQQGRKMEKQQIDWMCPNCHPKSTDKSDTEKNIKFEPKEKKVKLEIKETNNDRNQIKELSPKKQKVTDKVHKPQTKINEDKCGSSSHSTSFSKSDTAASSSFLNKKSFNKNSDRNISKGNEVMSNVKKGLKEPLRKKQNCITCQSVASVNSCYCSDKCLEKHANDCLATMREGKKGLKGSEFDSQKIVVLDRIRSNVIADDNAPTACNIISWLKANPNFMIVCSPSSSTSSKHSVQKKEVDSTTAVKDKKVLSDDTSKATVRCNVQKTLKNILMDRCKNADDIKLPEDDISKIAVKIEEELNSLFKDNAFKYRAKYRSLMFNIKDPRNQGLFRKILKGNIPPDKLVRMSPEELASVELAKWREQENQHSLDMIKRVQLEQQSGSGLLLKKTHKGEVEIEDDFSMIDDIAKVNTKSFSAEPVESEKPETDKEVAKDTTHHHRSHLFDLNCKICTGKILPPPVEDKTPKKIRVAHSISIDLNSPAAVDDIEKNVARIVDRKSPLSSTGDDSMDQEPTSTVSIGSPEIAVRFSLENDGKVASSVWKGFIFMQDVAKFVTSAYKVSGPTEYLYMDVPDTIQVCGRIIPDQVFDYLGKIKQSGSKELIIVRFQAANEEETVAYNSFYSYLSSRKRYGVVGNHSKKIKDFYILPLAATSPVPIVLMPFDGPGLPSPRTHLLLGVIIRHKDKQPALPVSKVEKHKEDRLDGSYTPPLETRSYTPPLETRSYTPPLPPLQTDNSLASDVYSPSVDLTSGRELVMVQNSVSSSEDVKMEDSDIYEPSYTPPFQMLPDSPKDEDKPYDPEQDILMMETDENNSKSRSKEDISKSTSTVELEKNKKILDALTRQMEETDRQVNVLKQLMSHPDESEAEYQSPSTQALDINSVAATGMSSFLDLPKNLQDLLNVVREKSLGNENGPTGERDVDMRINNLFNKSFTNSGYSGINEFDKAANVQEKNISPEATPPLDENDESSSAVVRPSDPRIKIRASFQDSLFSSEETSNVSLCNMSATELVEKAEKELAEMSAAEKTQSSSPSVPLIQEKLKSSNINKMASSCWNQFKEPPPPGIEPSDLEAQDSSYSSKSTSSTSDNQPHASSYSPLVQDTQQIGPHFPPPSQFPPPLPPGFSIQTPPPNIKSFPPPNVISTFFPPPPPPLPIVTKANDASPIDKTWPSWNVPPQQPKDSNWQFGEPQCDKNWKTAQETASLDSSSSSSHYYPPSNRDFNKDKFYSGETSSEGRWNRPQRFARNTWHKRPARGGRWRGKSFHFNKNQQK